MQPTSTIVSAKPDKTAPARAGNLLRGARKRREQADQMEQRARDLLDTYARSKAECNRETSGS